MGNTLDLTWFWQNYRASLQLQLKLAKAYQKSKKKQQAIDVYNEILKKQDKNLDAMKGLAELTFEGKDFQQAKQWLEEF